MKYLITINQTDKLSDKNWIAEILTNDRDREYIGIFHSEYEATYQAGIKLLGISKRILRQ